MAETDPHDPVAHPQTDEGALLEHALEFLRAKMGLSQNKAAVLAGISGTRWRDIVRGYVVANGVVVPVHAPAKTLARMSFVVGVIAEELRRAGRDDAAVLLEGEEIGGWFTDLEPDDLRLLERVIDGWGERKTTLELKGRWGLPVGLGLDDLADGLDADEVEAVKNVIRAIKGRK